MNTETNRKGCFLHEQHNAPGICPWCFRPVNGKSLDRYLARKINHHRGGRGPEAGRLKFLGKAKKGK